MKVKIVNNSRFALPEYQTPLSAGLDIRANLDQSVTLRPLERAMIPTGLFVELPEGYEMQIRPRSGLAAKHGITVLNSPGTIDAGYRGEIKCIMYNTERTDYPVKRGDRIAQMVIARLAEVTLEEVTELSDSDRAAGGFGSTGK